MGVVYGRTPWDGHAQLIRDAASLRVKRMAKFLNCGFAWAKFGPIRCQANTLKTPSDRSCSEKSCQRWVSKECYIDSTPVRVLLRRKTEPFNHSQIANTPHFLTSQGAHSANQYHLTKPRRTRISPGTVYMVETQRQKNVTNKFVEWKTPINVRSSFQLLWKDQMMRAEPNPSRCLRNMRTSHN